MLHGLIKVLNFQILDIHVYSIHPTTITPFSHQNITFYVDCMLPLVFLIVIPISVTYTQHLGFICDMTRVNRESYLLHVKDTLVDFEKEQANAATRQHTHPQSGKGLI